jgi:hypothetical protein
MPAQAAIAINDGQASPVTHTFAPDGALAQPDRKVVADWVDRGAGVKVGYLTIREQHAPSNGNQVEKMRWVITRPTLETLSNNTSTGIDPQPTKAFDTVGIVEIHLHDRAGEPELKDVVAFVKNFTATAYFAAKVTNRERTW